MCFCCLQMIGAAIFGLCLWLRFEPGIQEWVEDLHIEDFYIGLYILIVGSIIVMVVAFLGCLSALQENTVTLLAVSASVHAVLRIPHTRQITCFKRARVN